MVKDKYNKVIQEQLDAILCPIENTENTENDTSNDWYNQHIAVNTAKFIRYLASKACSIQFVEFYGENNDDRFDTIFGGEEWHSDNTYNYDEPYTHDMALVIPSNKDESAVFTIALAPHYGGDVRGNYGDYVVLTFNDYWQYIELCDEYHFDHAYDFTVDGHDFECYYTGGGEYYRLTELTPELNGEFDSDGFVPEPWTEQDFIESVRKHIKEIGS